MNNRTNPPRQSPLFLALTVALMVCLAVWAAIAIFDPFGMRLPPDTTRETTTAPAAQTEPTAPVQYEYPENVIRAYAEENGVSYWDYPVKVVQLLAKEPRAEDFALNYPLKYGTVEENIDMSDYKDVSDVPLFLQWDTRWGYMEYGNDCLGLTGCGPTSLAMVAYYYTKDPLMNPGSIAKFAIDNGYCVPGNGSSWSLISEGGEKLGLTVTQIDLDEERMIRNLLVGNPIICVMGPGVFTPTGHFIVLAGYENGQFIVNDCYSYENSQKRWEFNEFSDQIRAMWVIQE